METTDGPTTFPLVQYGRLEWRLVFRPLSITAWESSPWSIGLLLLFYTFDLIGGGGRWAESPVSFHFWSVSLSVIWFHWLYLCIESKIMNILQTLHKVRIIAKQYRRIHQRKRSWRSFWRWEPSCRVVGRNSKMGLRRDEEAEPWNIL